ncbi:hypothetical protein [Ruegeria sp. SCP11]|uniref:hypothetical protein n=1 Tax=Ruegeria sp. SCP11 TaxID=3141378 RepID=UPI00333DCA2C
MDIVKAATGSFQTLETAQHRPNNKPRYPHGRPKAAVDHHTRSLRCNSSNLPFAAPASYPAEHASNQAAVDLAAFIDLDEGSVRKRLSIYPQQLSPI